MYWNSYLRLFIHILVLFLYYIFFNYAFKLKEIKCDCANNNKRRFIQYYSQVAIVIVSIKLIDNLITDKVSKGILSFIYLIDLIVGVIFIAVMYNFTKELKDNKCLCSDSWEREFMHNYSKIILIIYIFIFFSSVSAIIHTKMLLTTIIVPLKFAVNKLRKIAQTKGQLIELFKK
jgi:hypothetical protein